VNRKIVGQRALSVGAVARAVGPWVFAALFFPACNGEAGGGGGGSGDNSGPGESGDGAAAGDGTVAVTTGCLGPDASPLPATCVIDDMTAVTTETQGYWYTFSDRTIPFSTSLIPSAQGTVDPAEGAQFPPDNVPDAGPLPDGGAYPTPGPGPSIPGLAAPAAQRTFSGGGLTLWGAGCGFDFSDEIPDDASPAADAGALGIPVPYDGSAHKGIAFWGKSNLGDQPIGVHLADNREAAGGGVRDASVPYTTFDDAGGGADIVKNPVECGVDFVDSNVTLTSSWKYYSVTWAAFGKSQTYSGGAVYSMPDTKNLFYLHFQANNKGYHGSGAVAPEPPFSVSIAYVTWYDGN
jgi:hypothetical protein